MVKTTASPIFGGHVMRTPIVQAVLTLTLALGVSSLTGAQETMRAVADPAASRGFLTDLAEIYRQQRNREVEIEVAASERVLKAIIDGEADVGALSRPPISSRLAEAGLTFQPVVWDAVVVVVHRDNPILNLTLKQAAAIFRGETTSWQPLGAGSGAIEVIAVAEIDGQRDAMEHIFTQLVLRGGTGIRASRTVSDTEALMQAVASSRNAIGLSSFGSARRVMEVKMLGIEGQPPATNTIRSGSYLLYTPLYLVSKPGGEKRRLVSDLMRFSSQSPTAQVLRRVGFVPYTDGMSLIAAQADRDAQIELRLR
jgi:phosphate transport system substrate-binding protein